MRSILLDVRALGWTVDAPDEKGRCRTRATSRAASAARPRIRQLVAESRKVAGMVAVLRRHEIRTGVLLGDAQRAPLVPDRRTTPPAQRRLDTGELPPHCYRDENGVVWEVLDG
jgi:hypothetical protein